MTPRTVVIVDDDPLWAETLADALQSRGWQVYWAAGPERLWELARRVPLTAVLLDVNLAGHDGLELLDQLHRLMPELPVVMMSASWLPRLEQEALSLGARWTWEKGPAQFDHLVQELSLLAASGLPALPPPGPPWPPLCLPAPDEPAADV